MRLRRGAADDRKRNRALLAAIRPLGQRLRELRSSDQLWPIVMEAAGVFGATSVRLLLETSNPALPPESCSHGFDGEAVSLFCAQFAIPSTKTKDRLLELGWSESIEKIHRDLEIAIDIFCEQLGEALESTKSLPLASASKQRIEPVA
jgi:hypothetical protein